MNTDNALLVVLLVVGIVVLANLAMFAMVRGSRGRTSDWLKNIGQPFKKEDDSMDELHRRVEELSKKGEKEE
jgi:uncharacterized protein YxeA